MFLSKAHRKLLPGYVARELKASKDLFEGTPCWLWQGPTSKGYGIIFIAGKLCTVHKLVFTALKGPVPSGLELDHRCCRKHCCSPFHLEAVTRRLNLLRMKARKLVPLGEHIELADHRLEYCKNGHPWTEENTYWNPASGKRRCVACHAATSNQAYHAMPDEVYEIHHQSKMAYQRDYRAQKREEAGLPPVSHELPTHCLKARHEFTPENTRITPKGERVCRECHRLRNAAYYKAKQVGTRQEGIG